MFSVMYMFTLNFLFCGDNDEFMCVLFCWRRTKKIVCRSVVKKWMGSRVVINCTAR